jgi:hypothetical protein
MPKRMRRMRSSRGVNEARTRSWRHASSTGVAADPTIATRLEPTGQVVDIRGPIEFTAGIKEMRDQFASIAQTLGVKGRGMNGGAAIPPVLLGAGRHAPRCGLRVRRDDKIRSLQA